MKDVKRDSEIVLGDNQSWWGLCLQMNWGSCPSGNVCEQSFSPRLKKQEKTISATVLFDAKMNFPPKLRIMNLQEIVLA